jgi:hypothetical protein
VPFFNHDYAENFKNKTLKKSVLELERICLSERIRATEEWMSKPDLLKAWQEFFETSSFSAG